MMTYEGLEKENIMLYNALAKQTRKLDNIELILKSINLFDMSYKELYDTISRICEIVEDKKKRK